MTISRILLVVSAGFLFHPQLPARATEKIVTTREVGSPLQITGVALRSALPELEKRYGVRLAAGASLQNQRVTILGAPIGVERSKRALKDLLSAGPEATVFWAKETGDVWRLEEDKNRKDLAKRLRDADQQAFREHLNGQLRWAREEGPKELGTLPASLRGGLIHKLMPLRILGGLTAAELSQFLDGEPLALTLGELRQQGLGEYLPEWTVTRSVFLKDAPNSDTWRVVFMRERNPADPQSGGVTLSLVEPRGFVGSVISVLRQPHPHPGTTPLTALLDPSAPAPQARGRQVTVNLTPAPGELGGKRVTRTLDEVLGALSSQLALSIVADGYLRAPLDLPANFELKQFPLEALLDRVALAWNCDWHYFENDKNCLIFRARHWWLEDASDVPQPLLDELTKRLGKGKTANLDDLGLLATLSDAQVYKLVNETKHLPAAVGLLPAGVYTGTGAKPCLQFYGQLPAELRKRVRSTEGLPLAEVDSTLVMRYLHRTLAMWVGAVSPEQRRRLLFGISDLAGGPNGTAITGYRVWIRSEQRPGSNWRAEIRLPTNVAGGVPDPK